MHPRINYINISYISFQKIQDIYDHLGSVNGRQPDGVARVGEEEPRRDYDETPEHFRPPLDRRDGPEDVLQVPQRLSDGSPIDFSPDTYYPPPSIYTSPIPTDVSTITIASDRHPEPEQIKVEGSLFPAGRGSASPGAEMLQQYQQQPDYTPYGGIGYGAQPNAGYFNYAATESSWYGSPSSGGDHNTQMVSSAVFVRSVRRVIIMCPRTVFFTFFFLLGEVF